MPVGRKPVGQFSSVTILYFPPRPPSPSPSPLVLEGSAVCRRVLCSGSRRTERRCHHHHPGRITLTVSEVPSLPTAQLGRGFPAAAAPFRHFFLGPSLDGAFDWLGRIRQSRALQDSRARLLWGPCNSFRWLGRKLIR